MEGKSLDLFTSLYSQNERYLLRFIASMLGQPADAADLLQETAKKIWADFDNYDRDREFLPWACTIARYQVMTYRKKQKVRKKYFSEEVVDLLAEDWMERDYKREAQNKALKSCVSKLDDKDRLTLDKRYESAQSLKDVAASTGQTPNALYKQLQRIRRNLFKCIKLKLVEV